MLTFSEMNTHIEKASLVITHGGPASFLNVLAKGKPLIVVPRKLEFEEHVNNHQIEFLKKLNQRGYNIPYIDNIDELDIIINQQIRKSKYKSRKEAFNEKFIELIQELVKG